MSAILGGLIATSLTLPILYLFSLSSPGSSPTLAQFPFSLDNDDGSHLPPHISSHRIVAVGDIHGSLETAQRVLRMAGVVDSEGGWAMEEGDTLVQTGDILDRGTDTIALFQYFEELRADAISKGGSLISLLGNHETMNALGDWRYVTKGDIDTFGGIQQRHEALSDEGWLGKIWLANYSLTAKVPLHPHTASLPDSAISFIHAGIPAHTPLLLPYPDSLNALAKSFMRKTLRANPAPSPPNPFPGLPSTLTPVEQNLWGGDGVWWYRGWASDPETPAFCARAQKTMEIMGVRRMVMGHTPNFEGILTRCNASIIVVDTGISPAYMGSLTAISITTSLHPLSPASPPHDDDALRRRDASARPPSSPSRLIEREVVRGYEVERDGEIGNELEEREVTILSVVEREVGVKITV